MTHAPFVARQGELAQLNQHLDRTLAGEGQVCFVTGDADSGKSTLVREFCKLFSNAHTVPLDTDIKGQHYSLVIKPHVHFQPPSSLIIVHSKIRRWNLR